MRPSAPSATGNGPTTFSFGLDKMRTIPKCKIWNTNGSVGDWTFASVFHVRNSYVEGRLSSHRERCLADARWARLGVGCLRSPAAVPVCLSFCIFFLVLDKKSFPRSMSAVNISCNNAFPTFSWLRNGAIPSCALSPPRSWDGG